MIASKKKRPNNAKAGVANERRKNTVDNTNIKMPAVQREPLKVVDSNAYAVPGSNPRRRPQKRVLPLSAQVVAVVHCL